MIRQLGARYRLRHPRLVVVTGAGSGIGRATALAFAEDGATVLVTDVDERAAQETLRLLREQGGAGYAYHLDVSELGAWEAFAELVVDKHGVPDVLVNNAGVATAGSFLEHEPGDWERLLGVNLHGVIHGCQVFGREMVRRGKGAGGEAAWRAGGRVRRGHIVNVGSMNSFVPAPNMSSYAVSKAGVKMLSECLRSELAEHGIGVTVVMPGMIDTNIVRAGTFLPSSGDDPALVQFVRSAFERAFSFGWPPSRVGRAIVRAVRYNVAVVPVGPEAWVGYWVSRLSPGLLRRGASQALAQEQLERAMRLLPAAVRDRLAS
ncbi:MAG: SDR family NAD(P)-dependent oxidoreductase [Acidimicrobiales bacterium]